MPIGIDINWAEGSWLDICFRFLFGWLIYGLFRLYLEFWDWVSMRVWGETIFKRNRS